MFWCIPRVCGFVFGWICGMVKTFCSGVGFESIVVWGFGLEIGFVGFLGKVFVWAAFLWVL